MLFHPIDCDREDLLTIIIPPGKSLSVRFANTDGEFVINYGEDELTVHTDMPDTLKVVRESSTRRSLVSAIKRT